MGLGGRIKISVYSDVKAGKVVIGDAKQFSEYANQRVIATTVMFVPDSVCQTQRLVRPICLIKFLKYLELAKFTL